MHAGVVPEHKACDIPEFLFSLDPVRMILRSAARYNMGRFACYLPRACVARNVGQTTDKEPTLVEWHTVKGDMRMALSRIDKVVLWPLL